jgi:hypothetical protein
MGGAETVAAGAPIAISFMCPQQQAQCCIAQALAEQGTAASTGSAHSRMPSTRATDLAQNFILSDCIVKHPLTKGCDLYHMMVERCMVGSFREFAICNCSI